MVMSPLITLNQRLVIILNNSGLLCNIIIYNGALYDCNSLVERCRLRNVQKSIADIINTPLVRFICEFTTAYN